MIITRITLQNYKQYRGEVVLEIPEDATIGVLGANGVGKTTIFEAIEWCLYKPRGINNADIRPRGTGGEVRVVLQLTTNDGAKTYEVERVLKRSSVQAAIYELNEMGGGEPIVQGTNEVTDYISTKLIGLGHAAFVATFFTRQKELSFFGTMRPADRRREVGKLLGLETIKQAQGLIAEERKAVNADAESLQRQYDGRVKDRDLDAEIEAAQSAIATHRDTVDGASATLETAEKATAAAEERVQALQEQRDRHNAIAGELRNLETRRQGATDQRDGVTRQLENLDQREQERGNLASTAQAEPALRAERQRLDAERKRHETRERLRGEMRGCGQTIDQALADVRQIVDRARQATTNPGWGWSDLDDRRPLEAIDRLAAIAASSDLVKAQARLNLYLSAIGEQKRLDIEANTLGRYRQRQQELQADLDEMLAGGEPESQRKEIEARQDAARTAIAEARSRITTAGQQETRARELATRLAQQHFDESCPTCGRPFSDAEAALVIETLHESIGRNQAETAEARRAIDAAEADLKRAQQQLSQVQEIERRINDCRTRLASGIDYVQQQEAKVASQETALHAVLEQIGLPSTPSADEVTEVERAVASSRALHDTVQPLTMIRRSIADARESMQRHETALAELVDIDWDQDRYTDVSGRHDAAMRAASAIEQIDRELARRPQLEHDLATAKSTIEELTASIADQRKALAAVGFVQETLDEATAAYQAARQQEREAHQRLTQADRAAHQAEHQLDLLLREKEQVAGLLAEANAKRAEKAELDMMYSEFSEFDKFVAQKQSPLLSETTSDIVAELTDGKYTRVEFDEDYGIQVYDDTDERFPLETFSGGERDAISLAARLALSRLIGSQAANPPGFLVLDEVFGSLDADRRERVLTLLGQHSTEFFRQMFIVSHIDDVQQSPVFDTIWQVLETEDGSSEVVVGATEPEAILAD